MLEHRSSTLCSVLTFFSLSSCEVYIVVWFVVGLFALNFGLISKYNDAMGWKNQNPSFFHFRMEISEEEQDKSDT